MTINYLEKLLVDLKTGELDTRIEAAEQLAKLGDLRAIDPLIAALDYRGPFYEFEAVRDALISFGKPAVHQLIAWLQKDGIPHKCYLVQVLGNTRDAEALTPLLTALQSPEKEISGMAVPALVDLGSPAIEPLLELVEHHTDLQVRRNALTVLARFTDQRILLLAKQALADPKLRSLAASALANYPQEDVIQILLGLLPDKNAWVRLSAVWSLGVIGDERAIEPLLALLDDTNETVRLNLVGALARVGGTKIVPTLIELLEDVELQALAAGALGEIGDKQAIPHLISLKHRTRILMARIDAALEKLES